MMMTKRPKKSHQRERRNVNIRNKPGIPSLLKHRQQKNGPLRTVVLQKALPKTAWLKPEGKVE
jgi:hypothetical protein